MSTNCLMPFAADGSSGTYYSQLYTVRGVMRSVLAFPRCRVPTVVNQLFEKGYVPEAMKNRFIVQLLRSRHSSRQPLRPAPSCAPHYSRSYP